MEKKLVSKLEESQKEEQELSGSILQDNRASANPVMLLLVFGVAFIFAGMFIILIDPYATKIIPMDSKTPLGIFSIIIGIILLAILFIFSAQI